MQKKNRLVSLFLALCMMLSLTIPASVSADTLSFSDVPDDYTYYSAITNLTAEGIINGFEDGTFQPEEPVTRAQFTKIICYALGVGELTYSNESKAKFTDVALDHWALDNITTAQNSGIINGMGDGTFQPESSVLYEQAVKMAVCALGYPEERANRAGGYPNGYISIAAKIKMLDKIVGASIGTPLTRGRVAQLIDNMLDADLYTTDENQESTSLREENTKQASANGRVVAVYGKSIYYNETSRCNRKQIELELSNGTRVFYGIENIKNFKPNDYLGRSVTVYYDVDSSADYNEAYSIAFQSKKNETVTVTLGDIDTYNNSEVEYFVDVNGRTDSISVSSQLAILHNGQAVNDTLKNLLDTYIGKTGQLTLLCSLDNNTADVAFLNTYETIIVNSIDAKNYKIYDYHDSSKTVTLDEYDSSKMITFTKNGESASFADIGTNNVVSIATSANGKFIDVQISTKRVIGMIESVLSDGSMLLKDDPTYYKFSAECVRSTQLNVGDNAAFYINTFGEVARYTITSTRTYTFGYLSAAENRGTFMEPELAVMVYKTGNTNAILQSTIYPLADTLKIDGKTYIVENDADDILQALRVAATNSGINATIGGTAPQHAEYSQPIRYSVTSSKEIDAIITNNKRGDDNVSLNITNHTTTPVECLSAGTKLGNYTIADTTKIMLIPSNRMSGTYRTQNNLYFKKNESYYVSVANTSLNTPSVIYVYGTATGGSDVTADTISESDLPMIVTATATVNLNGENRKSLKLMSMTGETLQVYDGRRTGTEAIATVAVGDVVRVTSDSDNIVNAIEIVAVEQNIASGTQSGFVKFDGTADNRDDLNAPMRVVLGLVHRVQGNTFITAPSFDYPTTQVVETYVYDGSVKVYRVDAANTNLPVQEVQFGEIKGEAQQPGNGSKIMVYTDRGTLKAIVIFK